MLPTLLTVGLCLGGTPAVVTSTASISIPDTLPECQAELRLTFDDAVEWEARARTTWLNLTTCQASLDECKTVLGGASIPLPWDPGEAPGPGHEGYSPFWRDTGLLLAGVVIGATVSGVVVGLLTAAP
jgi:hypothetical protein